MELNTSRVRLPSRRTLALPLTGFSAWRKAQGQGAGQDGLGGTHGGGRGKGRRHAGRQWRCRRVLGETRIPTGQRVRDVCEGSGGFLYVLIDDARDGQLIRLEPG